MLCLRDSAGAARSRGCYGEVSAMDDKKALIVLVLEGALQSWGDHSKWDDRDSGDFPTKSGVVGLIACAMGIERGSTELVELSDSMRIAVRADRPGTKAVDFHTVQGNPLRTAEGKRAPSASTVVSYRWYLEDACFTVFIEADAETRERIVSALKAPVWPPYLGRRSCVPSRPVFECVTENYTGLADALVHYPRAERSAKDERLRYESDVPLPGAASYTRSDAASGPDRQFEQRVVYTGAVRTEVQNVPD